MTAGSPIEVGWVAEPRPARTVEPGDTIEMTNGRLVHVTGAGPDQGQHRIDVVEQYWSHSVLLDPDHLVPVLVRRDVLVGQVVAEHGS